MPGKTLLQWIPVLLLHMDLALLPAWTEHKAVCFPPEIIWCTCCAGLDADEQQGGHALKAPDHQHHPSPPLSIQAWSQHAILSGT